MIYKILSDRLQSNKKIGASEACSDVAGVQGLESWALGFGELNSGLSFSSKLNISRYVAQTLADISATKHLKQILNSPNKATNLIKSLGLTYLLIIVVLVVTFYQKPNICQIVLDVL